MYCSKCGAQLADGAMFCSACGQAFSTGATAARPPIVDAPPTAYAPRAAYGGFWLRFVAFLIDNVVMAVAIVLICIPLIFLTGLGALIGEIHPEEEMNDAGFWLIMGVIFLFFTVGVGVTWLYHALMECSEWQATVGKKAMGLVVTDTAGQRVSFGRATGRHFAKIVTGMVPLAIGYIMAGFTEKKQALHDMIASCLILRRI